MSSDWKKPIPYREDGENLTDFFQTPNLANNATSTHDYTVPAGFVLFIKQLFASSSINFKVELQIETTGFQTKYVDFQEGGKQGLNPVFSDVEGQGIRVEAGKKVRVISTGRNPLNGAPVYHTLIGVLNNA